MTARKLSCVLLVLTLPAAAGAQQKVILRQQFPPGRYVLDVTGKLTQHLAVNKAQTPDLEISRRLVLGMEVLPPDAQGITRVDLSFRRIVYKVSSRGRSVAYDSAEKPAQLGRLWQLLSPLAKAQVSVAIGADGSVAEVRGLDELWDAWSRKDPAVEKWLKQTKAEMGDAMIRELFEQVPAWLKADAVAQGQSWKAKTTVRLPYVRERECVQRVTFKAISGKEGKQVAELELVGKSTDTTTADARADQMPLTVRKSYVVQRGQVHLQIKTGLPLSFSFDRSSTLTMTGNDPRKGAVTVVFSQNRTRTVTIRPDKSDRDAGRKTNSE